MNDEYCRFCGARIIKINPSDTYWVHQPKGAEFLDGTYSYCRITSAAPPPTTGSEQP